MNALPKFQGQVDLEEKLAMQTDFCSISDKFVYYSTIFSIVLMTHEHLGLSGSEPSIFRFLGKQEYRLLSNAV